jgi:colicin import membrane protein
MSTAIAEYSATEQALAELRQKYEAAVFDVTTGKGMVAAKQARAELREYRVALEAKRVELKAPILERGRVLDAEAKRITAELESLEKPIDASIKSEEQRKEREKAEREEAERQRVAELHARFGAIKSLPLRAVNATVEQIDQIIAEAGLIDPTTFPADMQAAAKFEQNVAIASLRAARDQRLADDARQAKIAADLAELERLRAERAAVQAEQDRLTGGSRPRRA